MVSTIVYFMTAGVGSPLVEYDTGHTASSELPCLEFPTFFWSQDGEETGNRCGSLGSKCALKNLFTLAIRLPIWRATPMLQATTMAPCSPSSQRPSDVSRYAGQLIFHIGKSVPNWDGLNQDSRSRNATWHRRISSRSNEMERDGDVGNG